MKFLLKRKQTRLLQLYFRGSQVQSFHVFRGLVLPHAYGYKTFNLLFTCAEPSSLPSSLSQATFNSVNRELSGVWTVSQSNGLKSWDEYLKISAKRMSYHWGINNFQNVVVKCNFGYHFNFTQIHVIAY